MFSAIRGGNVRGCVFEAVRRAELKMSQWEDGQTVMVWEETGSHFHFWWCHSIHINSHHFKDNIGNLG